LRNRQAPAYRTLEDWVGRTLANNPQLHERLSPPPAAPPLPKPAAPPAKADGGGEGSPPSPAGTQPAAPAPTFGAPHEPPDPFDPDAFNRQAHPTPPGK
jgi:hypothetical protein